jgi:hypothetical protein
VDFKEYIMPTGSMMKNKGLLYYRLSNQSKDPKEKMMYLKKAQKYFQDTGDTKNSTRLTNKIKATGGFTRLEKMANKNKKG